MELSKRLQAVADLLCDSNLIEDECVLADVGTDHGYLPIYLVQHGKCKKAYAMDVNIGPFARAKAHIADYLLQDRIETRLSDGVSGLQVGECDAVIVAGMGGALTVKIMTEGEDVFRSLKTFVLQPQSELPKVRRFLLENGYRIVAEDMVLEDGKFYPMMRVTVGEDGMYRPVEYLYGRHLLKDKNLVLKQFLERELRIKTEIWERLMAAEGAQIATRRQELEAELLEIKEALLCFAEI